MKKTFFVSYRKAIKRSIRTKLIPVQIAQLLVEMIDKAREVDKRITRLERKKE